ncbi:zinc (Zn2)-Iron (Fe2) Permease (ZIP) family [Thraustotheca clavata]|uniref:Zinc (Zn2)-Iron (Fe2) Permease (ZIP) family n=1 Tax=Thraustotheca clavata TaxID=74557 RepID=A0A1W0A7D8_9STRA|nr:zinc (Zn2)-Iron (Fe2) Permease (ZIP) family [Thraustotheca clavata]
MDALTIFKVVSLLSIWVVGFVGGVLPFFIRQHNRVLMSQLNCMSGGVFLAGGFMHLLHAAIENPGLERWSTMDEGIYAFPYAEMFCTIGFLGVLIVEQLAHALQAKAVPHIHTDDEESGNDSAPFLEQVEADIPAAPKKNRKKSHDDHIPFDKNASGTVAFVLFVALSFHSVLEGLGIGAQSTPAWGVFLAIIIHKGLAAFALGTGMLKGQLTKSKFIGYMLLFSLMSIIGIIIGWAVNAADSSEDSAAAGICLALASGTFIYVAVMEIIPQEFSHGKSSLQKTLLLCFGYGVFGAIAKWS